jgi:hypothetical protein
MLVYEFAINNFPQKIISSTVPMGLKLTVRLIPINELMRYIRIIPYGIIF